MAESEQNPYDQIKDKPCPVHDIKISGNKQTRTSVILQEFERARDASTVDEVMDALFEIHGRLDKLNVFSDVNVDLLPGPEDQQSCDLKVEVAEKDSTLGSTFGVYQQVGGETSVKIEGHVRNLLGYAEGYNLEFNGGFQESTEFSASCVKPLLLGTDSELEARIFKADDNHLKHSSFKEHLQGIQLRWSNNAHELSYELSHNHIDPDRLASRQVRQQAGHNLKSALRHVYMLDGRDDAFSPTSGAGLQLVTEFAGIGPDPKLQRYFKHEASVVGCIPLPYGCVLQMNATGGIILPWHTEPNGHDNNLPWSSSASPADPSQERTTSINERFFLGGPINLRGFRTRGVGPTDARRPAKQGEGSSGEASSSNKAPTKVARDALGGDFKLAASASFNFPFPNKLLDAVGARGHVFADVGTILPMSQPFTGARDVAKSAMNTMRMTTGIGLGWATQIGRVEINYCHIVRSQEFDRIKRGIQIGLIPFSFR